MEIGTVSADRPAQIGSTTCWCAPERKAAMLAIKR
jgi:hypothetical protein